MSSPLLVESIARRKLAAIRAERLAKERETTGKSPLDLDPLDFIPAINPRYERPEHLEQVVDLFRRVETSAVFALVSIPPQYGKTETILSCLARLIGRQPWRTNAYVTYEAGLAYAKSRTCRDYASAAGVTLRDDAQAARAWQTNTGGGLIATGIGGPLTGNPVSGVLVIDDPHKNREAAESALLRQRVEDWYTSTAHTRVHPGASIIILHTRWNEDDLIGKRMRDTEPLPDGTAKPAFEVVNLPAVLPNGEPLWHRRPLAFLEKARRVSEYDWWSLYMGSPRPRGTSVFRGAKFYTDLPSKFRVGKGVDLAYTAKTRADWSTALVLLTAREEWRNPATGEIEDADIFYVVEVKRAQCEVPAFASELAALNVSYPIGGWHWFCSTTERGVAQLVTADGVTVDPVLATADKFVRAQPVATAWNEGRVLVPKNAPWLKGFVDEVGSFTGVSDRHDDQVDALASAFESLRRDEPERILKPKISTPQSRWNSAGRGY